MVARAVNASKRYIAVHLPWKMRRALRSRIDKNIIYNVPNQYPVQRFAPLGSGSVGVIGLAACLALYDAVYRLEPACYGTVTVTGNGVSRPQNLRVPYGTPLSELIGFCQPIRDDVQIIAGDAFTGVPAAQNIPLLPGMTCILVQRRTAAPKSSVCIGCGRCVYACHKRLLPYEIVRHYESTQYMRLASLHPERCDGCNACSVICPAKRNISTVVQQAAAHHTVVMKWRPEDD